MTETEMTTARFLEILDAYGADPMRWPEAERIDALRLASTGDAAILEAVAEAEALDTLMDRAAVPALSPQAMDRLKRAARPSPFAKIQRVLQWQGPIWQPAGALAASLILGLTLGFASPDYASSLAALGEVTAQSTTTTTQGFDLFLDTENAL